ncbi:beta-ketoacyl synthase chain length factor [Reichenbachiella agarivorans]|uniref:Beta-ketoacyl synthase chain length factor n=1 Tax=Reichenbachiella agarivorans TaxID=2979464 RepID=A0ABY6CPU2_9BACT|nr:beta-ketoacyl synthase chain length factor [Reichenbachiella agarivorans]UXP32538.1 beta-ketoacyl synthase chain length factor [Reichenbachiella agarivorans]
MYIKAAIAFSPQYSFDDSFSAKEIEQHQGNKYFAVEPNYGDMIPRSLLRRMNKAVRMGVGAGLMTLKGQPPLDGIILGTANGGIDDSFKFLQQILEYEEGTLTPTNFVQSTPNSVAGSLALMSENIGYNITHVNYGLAFEVALLDAMMLFEEKKAKLLLVGAFEEISDHNYNMDLQAGWFKTGESASADLLDSHTDGTVKGEGSAMFVMDNDPKDAMAHILSIDQISFATKEEVSAKIQAVLTEHGVKSKEVALLLGMNGDQRTDDWYSDLMMGEFTDNTVYTFKNLVGEYPTATGFALWLSTQIFAQAKLPMEMIRKGHHTEPKHLLIYNHYKAKQHSLILLRNPLG